MAYYKIASYANEALCLNIYGSNVTSLSNHQNVVLWTDSGSNEQLWSIDSFASGAKIRSAVDEAFALNIYRDGTNNCDVYPVASNSSSDCSVAFTEVGELSGIYEVYLPAHSLYLTSEGSSNGSNVYWAARHGKSTQRWVFTVEGAPEEPDEPVINIAKWSWTSSNGSATAAQTRAAYSAITGNGAVSDFSYWVWNDLCAKVKECIDAEGTSWYTNGGVGGSSSATYSGARMSASNKTLTASRFNAVRGNVGGRVSTGVLPVSSGDPVYGEDFVAITTALNKWIGNLNT